MCRSGTVLWLLGLAALVPSPARAHLQPRQEVGSLVSVSVEIEGRTSPLYLAPDGSGRYYVEALPHTRYALRLQSHTSERVGVVITVDGLNVISGDPAAPGRPSPAGRMYVLSPWDSVTVRGWRTSLDEVRRFTFVDEQRSYATRSGKANAKMGWIELAVYRELRRAPSVTPRRGREIPPPYEGPAAPEPEERDQAARSEPAPRATPEATGDEGALAGAAPPRSYPGTGWGDRADDAAVLVDFDPHPHAAERLTLRYEYAPALRALGIDIRSWLHTRDRLRERDRGDGSGFAKPPAW